MDSFEAHLLLRALRYGDPHGYGDAVLRSIAPLQHKEATPYAYFLCSNCGIVHSSYSILPVQSGCDDCCSSEYSGQQHWIYHSNMLYYFSNLSYLESSYINEALSTMWELQENVSL